MLIKRSHHIRLITKREKSHDGDVTGKIQQGYYCVHTEWFTASLVNIFSMPKVCTKQF